MKIKALKTFNAAPNGMHVVRCEKGEHYHFADRYALRLIEAGFAKEMKKPGPKPKARPKTR